MLITIATERKREREYEREKKKKGQKVNQIALKFKI